MRDRIFAIVASIAGAVSLLLWNSSTDRVKALEGRLEGLERRAGTSEVEIGKLSTAMASLEKSVERGFADIRLGFTDLAKRIDTLGSQGRRR